MRGHIDRERQSTAHQNNFKFEIEYISPDKNAPIKAH